MAYMDYMDLDIHRPKGLLSLITHSFLFFNTPSSATIPQDWPIFVELSVTHWGQVTHICVSKLTIIGSDNGLSPGRRQAIIWTNAGVLLIRTLGTNFSEILGEIHSFSFSKMHLKMSSAKLCLFGLGLNELTTCQPLCYWKTKPY